MRRNKLTVLLASAVLACTSTSVFSKADIDKDQGNWVPMPRVLTTSPQTGNTVVLVLTGITEGKAHYSALASTPPPDDQICTADPTSACIRHIPTFPTK